LSRRACGRASVRLPRMTVAVDHVKKFIVSFDVGALEVSSQTQTMTLCASSFETGGPAG
jgi:hypothetical protein